jgi:flagellar basal body-associated protein FliL
MIVFLIVLAFGTMIYTFTDAAKGKTSAAPSDQAQETGTETQRNEVTQQSEVTQQEATPDVAIFTALQRQRYEIKTSSGKTSILIVYPAFPYDAADSAFREELYSKINEFRASSKTYFENLAPATLRNDDKIKSDLLDLFNRELHLGKINDLYMIDFLLID